MVGSPEPGQVIPTAHDLMIRWDATLDPVMVTIFDQPPPELERLEALTSHLVWGAVAVPSRAPRLTWADGYAVRDGTWQPGRPAAPPDGPYALLVISVNQNIVVAASNLITFWIGAQPAWPAPGAACASELAIPGGCHNPAWPQVCWYHQCYRLCSSSADCSGTLCQQTNAGGFRTCAL